MKEVIMQVASYSSDYPKAPIYAADLVRCKECKEYGEWLDGKICMRLGSYYGNTKPDDFCSYGERKEKTE